MCILSVKKKKKAPTQVVSLVVHNVFFKFFIHTLSVQFENREQISGSKRMTKKLALQFESDNNGK